MNEIRMKIAKLVFVRFRRVHPQGKPTQGKKGGSAGTKISPIRFVPVVVPYVTANQEHD